MRFELWSWAFALTRKILSAIRKMGWCASYGLDEARKYGITPLLCTLLAATFVMVESCCFPDLWCCSGMERGNIAHGGSGVMVGVCVFGLCPFCVMGRNIASGIASHVPIGGRCLSCSLPSIQRAMSGCFSFPPRCEVGAVKRE